MHDDEVEWLPPGRHVTRRLYREWCQARRGGYPGEDMTNPVWEWMFRGRIDPYHAGEHFKGRVAKLRRKIEFPNEPRWAGCRLGRSCTKLSDGREVWIAGEHEDYYDPDFFIYNDVIIRHPGDRIQILGYPDTAFRPTDFHTATSTQDESAIIVVGNLGYPDDRKIGLTQVYHLDTGSFEIREINAVGDHPGWISKHQATLSEDGESIFVRGGKIFVDGDFIENLEDWSLNLSNHAWTRLTTRNWAQLRIARDDEEKLHLWQYSLLHLARQCPEVDLAGQIDLAAELGTEPRFEVYETLFQPSIEHDTVESPVEEEDEHDWQTTELLIAGVNVRLVSEMDAVRMIVEGDMPESMIQSLAEELREKLAIVENAECAVTRLG